MGTNYYLHGKVCAHCGRGEDPLHIGKSSGGWCFGLHVIPEKEINSLEDWKMEWVKDPASVIRDEYGNNLTPEEMLLIITKRTGNRNGDKIPFSYDSWESFHRENHSSPGPNGLVRHAIGDYCVGHGEGTWDLIPGEFS